MKPSRRTTMPQRKKGLVFRPPEELGLLFTALKQVLKPYARCFHLRIDLPQQYELWSEHEFRTSSFHPRRQQGLLFAGIAIKNAHVGFYFYLLHLVPEFELSLSQELKDLRKGKSALHITTLNENIKARLDEMLQTGFDYYKAKGWVFRDPEY
jgi:hypothetical protein